MTWRVTGSSSHARRKGVVALGWMTTSPLLSSSSVSFHFFSCTGATGGEVFSFSSSHRFPPLLSLPTPLTKTKKTTVIFSSSQNNASSLGFRGVLAPLNRTRNGPEGGKAHLRPKPKESSKKRPTHTNMNIGLIWA